MPAETAVPGQPWEVQGDLPKGLVTTVSGHKGKAREGGTERIQLFVPTWYVCMEPEEALFPGMVPQVMALVSTLPGLGNLGVLSESDSGR